MAGDSGGSEPVPSDGAQRRYCLDFTRLSSFPLIVFLDCGQRVVVEGQQGSGLLHRAVSQVPRMDCGRNLNSCKKVFKEKNGSLRHRFNMAATEPGSSLTNPPGMSTVVQGLCLEPQVRSPNFSKIPLMSNFLVVISRCLPCLR